MKLKKFSTLFRGLAAVMAVLLTLSVVGYAIAMSDLARGMVDDFFGVDRTIYDDWTETVPGYTIPGSFEGFTNLKGVSYTKSFKTLDDFIEAFVAHAVKQGEEGFALLRNEEKNGTKALPLNKSNEVVLYGWNAYNLPGGHTGIVAGNFIGERTTYNWRGQPQQTIKDSLYAQKSLYDALNEMADVKVNTTVTSEDFPGATSTASWSEVTLPEKFEAKETWNIAADSTAIVMVGRGGGEGSNWKPDSATNADDPLALSNDELAMIKYAKAHSAKVVLLVVSASAMELGPAVEKNGEYEVDAIGFCGIPNDFQYVGIANVLAGKVNATGGLTDTYAYDNSFNPAVINMGEQQYADKETITSFTDPLGRNTSNYYANNYIVEAEGIYVGYKYYETRYFDSIANPSFKADDAIGSTTGKAWNYANEVVFPFGQSLSYIPYTQKVTDIYVDVSEHGKVIATVEVTNNGTQDGYFLAQLYVNRPYTETNIANKVEKAAVDFLNSGKVFVKAGESKEIKITLPTRYLASWDSLARNGKGSYILDAGDYMFTAAAGAHAAVNNFLAALGHETDETTAIGEVATWKLDELDETTYSMSNGVEVKNQMQNSDINYFYGKEVVKYLTRSDWKGTFPKNYTNFTNGSGIEPEAPFNISEAAKKDEWLIELISAQLDINPSEDETKWAEINGIKPADLKDGQTVWQWIMSFATSDPDAFNDIHSAQWQAVAKAIPLDAAIASVPNGGSWTRSFPGIDSPTSKQSESVVGYQQELVIPGHEKGENGKDRTFAFNIGSNTLLGSSFNPVFALEWGLMEGESGLWVQELITGNGAGNALTVWGAGLNQHRTPYNGRNSEYMSEDPMLTNRIGEAQMKGAVSKGAICGPKHMGFNDQEKNREGNACYMTEQKVRETDTRCYEGALRADEGNGTGVMMSFARIGATNVTNSVGYIKNIMRGEWGFTGIITTDMGKGAGYHEVGALIQATVNQYASMSGGNFTLADSKTGVLDETKKVNNSGFTFEQAKKDAAFAAQARQTALYELYTIAHSSSGLYVQKVENTGEDIVVPETTINHHDPIGQVDKAPWQNIFIALEVVFGILTGLTACAWIATLVLPEKKEEK